MIHDDYNRDIDRDAGGCLMTSLGLMAIAVAIVALFIAGILKETSGS